MSRASWSKFTIQLTTAISRITMLITALHSGQLPPSSATPLRLRPSFSSLSFFSPAYSSPANSAIPWRHARYTPPGRWQLLLTDGPKIWEVEFNPVQWSDDTDDYGNDRQPMMSYSYLILTIFYSSIFLRFRETFQAQSRFGHFRWSKA